MRSLRRLGTALLLTLTTVVACGDDDDGPSSAQFAAEYCALYQPCCQAAGLPVTQQGCRLLFGSVPIQDGAAAQQCLDEFRVRAQAPDFCELRESDVPASCQRAFPQNGATGTAAPGAPCDFTSDCAPSARGDVTCNHSFDADTSFCQVRVAAPEGAPCAGTRDGSVTIYTGDDTQPELALCSREDGLSCEQGACKRGFAFGSACSSSSECANGRCASGVCQARLVDGAMCPSSDHCASNFCGDSGVCEKFNLGGTFGLALFCA
jgi:hypothetical protein